ncbi:hypothetical protein CEUSTIGMA_g8167.t1 [Chlamydomonas eustigma]|uniref:CobW C-terminal domain-containing protein n=1 Tax=Chlamydomonas eustigma TaxID=1157962 RepID=A0A250XCW9_9CHLO|nr:hypothetical protein CEUSTIGMA_g8167.t1 [Chlamydomonas eustigma]|eukprot:GAX80732.1 hypothetical protein CEUSTIGMA_g8167.t1 [Chlamydomonas eustigma]
MPSALDCLNLYNRHENLIFSSGTGLRKEGPVPAIVLTGFLGSGKTTIVTHLLKNRGGLKIGVLINEVGAIDIDSELVNAKQSNAIVGLPTADLSGGCICCSRQDQLQEALQSIRTASHLDYLILETSGVADPEELALSLGSSGFRLDAVVTVVDAEAAEEFMKQAVAVKQLKLADVVIINKCDLATLGQVSGLEDQIRSMCSPGVRPVRARFGQVPLPSVLDVEVTGSDFGASTPSHALITASSNTLNSHQEGFLSHESQIVSGPSYRVPGPSGRISPGSSDGSATAGWSATAYRRRQPTVETHTGIGGDVQHTDSTGEAAQSHSILSETAGHTSTAHGHNHGSTHSHLHEGYHTRSFVWDAEPLHLEDVQRFIVKKLLVCPGLLRSKGLVWLKEFRSHRFILHVSGRRRAECCMERPWESPPLTQLVFIGINAAALDDLVNELTCLKQQQAGAQSDLNLIERAESREAQIEAVAELVLTADSRLIRCMDSPNRGVASSAVLLEFSSSSSPLHGVYGEEVNAAIMSKVNALGRVFFMGRRAEGNIDSSTAMQRADRITSIIMGMVSKEDWEDVCTKAIKPILSKAFQHVHNCKCDVAALMSYDASNTSK